MPAASAQYLSTQNCSANQVNRQSVRPYFDTQQSLGQVTGSSPQLLSHDLSPHVAARHALLLLLLLFSGVGGSEVLAASPAGQPGCQMPVYGPLIVFSEIGTPFS